MNGFIIVRSNGIVTQVWEANDASWSFFIGGMSRDVQWHLVDKHATPKIFKSFDEAKWYLDQRAKRLKGSEKKKEKDWTYKIFKHRKEASDGVDHQPEEV